MLAKLLAYLQRHVKKSSLRNLSEESSHIISWCTEEYLVAMYKRICACSLPWWDTPLTLSDYPFEGAVIVNSFTKSNTLSSDCRVRKVQVDSHSLWWTFRNEGKVDCWPEGKKISFSSVGILSLLTVGFKGCCKQQTHITPAAFCTAGTGLITWGSLQQSPPTQGSLSALHPCTRHTSPLLKLTYFTEPGKVK